MLKSILMQFDGIKNNQLLERTERVDEPNWRVRDDPSDLHVIMSPSTLCYGWCER